MTLPQTALKNTTHYMITQSPVGALLLGWGLDGLTLLTFHGGPHPLQPEPGWVNSPEPFADVLAQLRDYFEGQLTSFDLPLAPHGTEFQRRVWAGLLTIPYGDTLSYGQLASRIGNPRAVRAVGAANGSNPLAIVVPCHRVIGGNGLLTGFGGGLEVKAHLLKIEGALDTRLTSQLSML